MDPHFNAMDVLHGCVIFLLHTGVNVIAEISVWDPYT